MKKSIIGIFIFVFSLCFCCVSGQYLYFSGTGKHFKQGCSDSISMKYSTEGKSTTIDNDAVIHAYVKYGLNLLNISFTKTNNIWGYKMPLSYDNNYFEFEVNNGTNDVSAGDYQLGTISFTPGYSQQDHYVSSFVFNQPGGQANGSFMSFASDPIFYYDYLTGDINVYQELCNSDGTPPDLNINYSNGSTYKTKKNLVINLKDDSGNSSSAPYIWSGAIKGTAGSYWTGNPGSVTNQDGIDIDDPNFQVTISGGALNNVITLHTGDFIVTPSNKTWEYKDRDYRLTTGLQGFDFGMEKAVTITVSSIKDRSNPSHSKDGISVTFNRPQGPSVSDKYPTAPSYIFRDAAVGFKVSDGWAGVDSGTITLTLSGYNYKQTFTADQLKITCATEGACGITGSAGGYNVYLSGSSHDKFPYGKPIYVTVSAKDLLRNAGGDSWQFGVVQDCITLGFLPPTEIRYGDNQAVSPYTGSELTISGSNVTTSDFEEYILSGVTYTGRIFEVDCHQADSALSLYRGIESNNENVVSGLLLDELVLSGTNPETIRAELDGNQLTLSYWIDGLEITQNSPAINDVLTSRTVSLVWELSEMDSYDWLSGFVVAIYTGNDSANIVSSGFVQYVSGTGMTTTLNTIEDRTDYYWSIYAVDKAGRTGNIESLGEFTVSVNYLVNAMTVTPIYPTGDVNTGILDFTWSTGGQIDNTMVGEFSGFIVSVYSGEDVIFTGWTDATGWTNSTGLDNGSYSWSVSVVDTQGNTHEKAKQSFEVQLERTYTVKVYPGSRTVDSMENYGDLRLYSGGQLYLRFENFHTNDEGYGEFTGLIDSGVYTVVYKGQSHLASYLSGYEVNDSVLSFDFTTGDKLYGTYESDGYQRQYVGDLKNTIGNYGFMVVGNAIAIITSSGFINGGVELLDPKNLNGDASINGSDVGLIGQNFEKEDIYKKIITW